MRFLASSTSSTAAIVAPSSFVRLSLIQVIGLAPLPAMVADIRPRGCSAVARWAYRPFVQEAVRLVGLLTIRRRGVRLVDC